MPNRKGLQILVKSRIENENNSTMCLVLKCICNLDLIVDNMPRCIIQAGINGKRDTSYGLGPKPLYTWYNVFVPVPPREQPTNHLCISGTVISSPVLFISWSKYEVNSLMSSTSASTSVAEVLQMTTTQWKIDVSMSFK